MRRRTYVDADEWRRRLDACMRMVLADPATFPEATVLWARWRREWLAESGSLSREPAERAETAEGEELAGPSSSLPPAGGMACTTDLAAGGENWPKTPVRGAAACESTTSAPPPPCHWQVTTGTRAVAEMARGAGAAAVERCKTRRADVTDC